MNEATHPETQVVAGVELVFEFRMTHPGCKGHAFDALATLFSAASPPIHDAGVPTFGRAPDHGCVSAATSSDRAPPPR